MSESSGFLRQNKSSQMISTDLVCYITITLSRLTQKKVSWIPYLCNVLIVSYFYTVWNFRKDIEVLEHFQRRTIKLAKNLKSEPQVQRGSCSCSLAI